MRGNRSMKTMRIASNSTLAASRGSKTAFRALGAPLLGAALGLASLPPVATAGDTPPASGTGGFFSSWIDQVSKTQAEQPGWITPLTTVTPRLEQEYRYDESWQSSPGGRTLTSYGGGKGLELIPCENVEVILGIPAYQTRNIPAGQDGWGDESFLLKYRILSGNADHGDYILTAFLGVSAPTGDKFNTSDHYTTTPTLAYGKGWGDFDFQSTLGFAIPDYGAASWGGGTPVLWNTALQYRLLKVLWPEVELNYTYWPEGVHEGKSQAFITPGLILGRFPIWERVGFTLGVGAQIAVTDRPLYNHSIIISARLPF
jgi:hypothetical protein